MDQCFIVGKVFFSTKASPFFPQTYLLWWWPKSYILVLSVKSTLCQKASGMSMFSFAYFRCWIFRQHCHVGLCCLKYILWLSCEQLDLCLLLFFAALLQWCVGSSENLASGHSIWDLSWSSRPCLDFNCSNLFCLKFLNGTSIFRWMGVNPPPNWPRGFHVLSQSFPVCLLLDRANQTPDDQLSKEFQITYRIHYSVQSFDWYCMSELICLVTWISHFSVV